MFASQLLRILQTIPADVNYETWVFDAPEVKLTMKENQNEMSCPSNGFERKSDPLAFKIEDGHDSWNESVPQCAEVVDRRADGDDKEATDYQKVGDQEGPLCHSNGCKRGLESSNGKDELWSSPEFEHSMIVASFNDQGEKESGDSGRLCTSISQLFDSDSETHFYTDKSVRECELPEVTVCYKESNYQIVKDICVDEGLPTQDKTLIETDKDGHAGLFVSQPCSEDKHSGTTKGCHDMEPSPDGLDPPTVEDIIHGISSERGTKEVDVATFILDGSKSSLEDDDGEDAIKVLGPANSTQMDEANLTTTEEAEYHVSEDESTPSSRDNSSELIVQDSHLQSSNSDDIEAQKQLDEVPSVEAILESLAVAFATEDAKKNGAAGNMRYNSKVEGGTITFDFNSSKPALSADNGSAENNHEESLKSEDVPNGKHENLEDNSATTLLQRDSDVEKNENVREQPKATQSQDAVDNSRQIHRGDGESSFSSSGPVSGLITYSGPIAYSGSISLRSDSSTTSTRSFAFPVLQSEWSSSPVRMVKAERRHFRKHRGWRQGLFCCRF